MSNRNKLKLNKMKEKQQISWQWNGESILLTKLSYGQLNTIKNLLTNTKQQMWFGNSKKIILTEINSIETNRNKFATKQAIRIIVDNRANRIKTLVSKLDRTLLNYLHSIQTSENINKIVRHKRKSELV